MCLVSFKGYNFDICTSSPWAVANLLWQAVQSNGPASITAVDDDEVDDEEEQGTQVVEAKQFLQTEQKAYKII